MRIPGICLAVSLMLAAGTAQAFDPNSTVTKDSGPLDLLKFAFSAYKLGRKDEAVEAYRYAAEKGHPAARWKLAQMYAAGDGVKEDDYAAFQMFQGIVRNGTDPGSGNDAFVSSALVALAGYIRRGIPGSPVGADPGNARDLYVQAASSFGNPTAQFELGRMLLNGEGGPADPRQAARWFKLAAEKGHVGAQAMLGNVLFQSGRSVRGLTQLTIALERAAPVDKEWIRPLHEEAFGLASEEDRRAAIALAQKATRN